MVTRFFSILSFGVFIGTSAVTLAAEPPPNVILVVADNCSDDTAERARAAGAEVLERDDKTRLGKGYALELAFEHALSDPSVGAVLVVDADTQVRPNFLVAMGRAFERGADGVQCRYLVSNADEHRLRNVALLALGGLGRASALASRWGSSATGLGCVGTCSSGSPTRRSRSSKTLSTT